MQVAGIRRVGARVEMIEVGEPRPLAGDEVLLEVRAAGVANWDEFVRTGGWDVGAKPPMALGVEAAGTVLAAGQAVSDWAPGDAVMTHPVPLRDQGTWAPRLIAPAGLLARKPPGASWEAAAAFPVPALTAEQVLGDALNVRAGEQLLVHGAGGVTGGLLVALGALRGAQVIATAGPQPAAGKRARGAPRHRLPRPRLARTGSRAHRDAAEWPPRPTRYPAAPPSRSGRSPTAAGWRPSPPTRPASSAASPSPASTSARTGTSCANSRRLRRRPAGDSGRRQLPSRRCRPGTRPGNRRPRRRSHRPHALTQPPETVRRCPHLELPVTTASARARGRPRRGWP